MLKGAFRYLLQSKLNTTKALQQIQKDRSLACAEVQYLVDFIQTSQRGVILRRATRRAEEVLADEYDGHEVTKTEEQEPSSCP